MKVNVEVECTPAEAREFLGMPDIRELQASLLKRLEGRLVAGLDALSPEGVLQNWFALNVTSTQRLQELIASFLSRSLGGAGTSAKETPKS